MNRVNTQHSETKKFRDYYYIFMQNMEIRFNQMLKYDKLSIFII